MYPARALRQVCVASPTRQTAGRPPRYVQDVTCTSGIGNSGPGIAVNAEELSNSQVDGGCGGGVDDDDGR